MKNLICLFLVIFPILDLTFSSNKNMVTDNSSIYNEYVSSISSKVLHSVSVPNYPEVYTEINHSTKQVLLIIPLKSLLILDKVPLSIKLNSGSTSNLVAGKNYDLTKPFKFEITKQDKSTINYTIMASKCNGKKSALVISDTQNDIIPLFRQEQFFKNINLIQKKAHNAKVPIYYIMLEGLKGTPKWDLPKQLTRYKTGIIVDKPHIFDAFEVESFNIDLLKKGVGKVYVVGVSSMGCVKGTCEGALKKKFDLVLVSDAHSEPIGYREESAIDKCNEIFKKMQNVALISTKEVVFD